MKTFLDDLVFSLEEYNNIEPFYDSTDFLFKLQHLDLPIEISFKVSVTDKLLRTLGKREEYINRTIHRLYKEAAKLADGAVSAIPITTETGKKIYFPEWDEQEKKWFIFNDLAKKCYTYKELILTS